MEIEFSESQLEKVEILKEKGISVGEAIDILFEMRDSINEQSNIFVENRLTNARKEKAELQEKIDKIDNEISVFEKLKDTTIDVDQKQKIIENEFLKMDTYDRSVLDKKHSFKWSKKIF